MVIARAPRYEATSWQAVSRLRAQRAMRDQHPTNPVGSRRADGDSRVSRPLEVSASAFKLRRSTPVLVIVTVFVFSRVAAYAAGVRFDDGLLHNAYQLLDVRLLRDDPFTSIFYLHSQPPLFNLFTAAVVQLPGSAVQSVLALLWGAAGLATALLLHATLRRLGVRSWLATVIVCVYLIAPETLLTESWFFYSQLQLLLSALTLFALTRFASTRRTTDGALFAGSLGALVLLRSSIHILLMVLLLVIVWRQLRLDARRMAVIVAVPLLVVGAWSVKNVVVFDSWTNSTWAGMNLSYVGHAGVTRTQCERLVAHHTVSASACRTAFRRPAAYTREFPHPTSYGAAATDRLYKSTGQPNFNASLYIDVASQYQHDSIELLRHGGITAIARAELAAYTDWAQPGDDSLQLRKVRAPISAYADWFDRLVLLRPVATGWNHPARFTASAGAFPWGDALGAVSYTVLALFGFALYGAIAGWRRGRSGGVDLRCVCTVAGILLLTSVVVGNALDYRENNRFRVEAAPFILVLAALGLEFALRQVADRRRRSAPTTENPTPTLSPPRR
jgi:hypothetical protein